MFPPQNGGCEACLYTSRFLPLSPLLCVCVCVCVCVQLFESCLNPALPSHSSHGEKFLSSHSVTQMFTFFSCLLCCRMFSCVSELSARALTFVGREAETTWHILPAEELLKTNNLYWSKKELRDTAHCERIPKTFDMNLYIVWMYCVVHFM